jgi:hypothetical protein
LNSTELNNQDFLLFIDTDPKFEKHCGAINEFENNNHENLEKEHCDEEMEDS